MSHAVNEAVRKIIASGIPFSASVMVPCPWFAEAAQILRDHPQVSVGIHLTLNSEWEHYKWGPILGASRVPSLVGDGGYFFATEEQFAAREVDLEEVRAELRAQIERALRAGLRVDYLDYHMRTAISTPGLRLVVEDLGREFGLGMAQYFGESLASIWEVGPENKLASLLEILSRLEPGELSRVVIHPGLETPEMSALVDLNNPSDPFRVARHRQAELEALTSPAFLQAVARHGIRLLTYRDIIHERGLASMTPPPSAGSYSGPTQKE